ncbi:response regulator [bacterium]|nr:response regulator [bacterium]
MKKIYIVEDEAILAQDIRRRLEMLRYDVTGISASGDKALRQIGENRPDLVLMDIVLRGELNGIETAEMIRDRFRLPVVFLTSFSDPETVQKAISTQPYGYITKPVNERELFSTIELALHKHETEEALRKSEAWLDITLKSIADGIIATDREGLILFMNPVAAAITEWTVDDVIQMPFTSVFRLIDDAGREIRIDLLNRAKYKNKKQFLFRDAILVTKYNRHVQTECSCALIHDSNTSVYGLVFVFRDITQRKILEAEAMHAAHLKSLGELSASVAHEINNPLTGIINYAQLLDDETADVHIQELTGRIIREGNRVSKIVRNLLTFARREDEESAWTQIHEVLDDSMGLVLNRMKKDGIQVTMDIHRNLPAVVVKPRQIQQVFLNLLSNAAYALNQKYAGFHKDKQLHVSCQPASREGKSVLRIQFHDSGTGIEKKNLDRIVTAFYTTKPAGEGTGLGLSISSKIIEDHQGWIDFESEAGKYTRVIVDLPVRRPGKRK